MKLLVVGARYCVGVSKIGRSFDFCEVNVLTLIKPFESENFSIKACKGFELTTLNCTLEVINLLPVSIADSPIELDFETDTVLQNGQLKTIIVGINN